MVSEIEASVGAGECPGSVPVEQVLAAEQLLAEMRAELGAHRTWAAVRGGCLDEF